MGQAEQRQHLRHPVELRVRLRLFGGRDIEAYTSLVSRAGMSLRLPEPVEASTTGTFLAHLPDGHTVLGEATCRNVVGHNLAGFAIHLEGRAAELWEAFIAQEESTGSLWRMISRYREGQEKAGGSVRDVVVERSVAGTPVDLGGDPRSDHRLRFHTVGENGEAYRVMFERCPSDAAFDSDLLGALDGFDRLAERAVARVMKDDVILRQGEHAPLQKVRVAELVRGGWAYVQGGQDMPASLVSLVVGELILVEVDGVPVFPRFSPDDLERIACDTFRSDMGVAVFGPPLSTKGAPAPVELAELPTEGLEAVKIAQKGATQVETRTYGERQLSLYPQIWARSRQKDGFDVMGPTMRDGDRVLLLVLVGGGAPRVLRVDENTDVKLMLH